MFLPADLPALPSPFTYFVYGCLPYMCALCACSNGMTCRHSSGSNDGTRACGEMTPAGEEPHFRNKPLGVGVGSEDDEQTHSGHGSGESFLAFLSSLCN